MLLKEKVILVTGSTTGIGAAIARHCINEGAKVMIHGRNEERAQKLSHELGSNCAYAIAEIGDPQAPAKMIQATVDKFGYLHGLVNNAGISPRCTIDNSTVELFAEVIATNLRAPLLLIREAVKVFRKQKSGGSIVNIGSINAFCGQPDLLIYSISKGGLLTMTRNLADALGPEGIRVNHLNVGWTATENEILLKQSEGLPKDWYKKVPEVFAPSGKLLEPTDIAPHVAFWLSDSSAPVNGADYTLEQYPMIGRNRIVDMPDEG